MKSNFLRKLISLVLMLIAVQMLSAKNYYVATNGSDGNPGTENRPFKTIQKAANLVNPGDVVLIKRGIYRDKIQIRRSGTNGNRIIFKAFPGDELRAIIEGTSLRLLQSSHIEISGLRVQNILAQNGPPEGIYVEGPASDITIRNNHTFNTFGSGISAWGVPWRSNPGNFNNIRNLKILNNKVEKACNGGFNECITLSNGVNGFQISNNEIFNGGNPVNGGEGIDVKLGVQNGTISFNYLHGLTRRGIYIDAAGILNFAKPFAKKIKVFNNRVRDCKGQGMALMTEGKGDIFDVDIYNNLFYNNTEDGLMFFDHPAGNGIIRDVRAVNNTCYNNNRFGILLNFPRATGIVLRNNILYQNKSGNLNLKAGQSVTSNNLVGPNPLFVNANQANFRLRAGSPAINKGTTQNAPNTDFDGNSRNGAVDIGAFEFGGNTPPPTPTPNPGSNNIPFGKIIWLKANQGKAGYVVAERNLTDAPLKANRNRLGQWEKFRVENAGNGKVHLKALANNKYVQARINDNGKMLASTNNKLGWETFTWESKGNGKVALKAFNNKYVQARLNLATKELAAIADTARDWETFNWGETTASGQKSLSEKNITYSLYPNPTDSNNLVFIDGVKNKDTVSIYDINGAFVATKTINNGAIEVSELAIGIYFITVNNRSLKLIIN
ncbi:choice-of-anchor Q domain-containing protein [Aquimarina agarilytica]|uniref:choice-of-anchor Q domain-containing protein n=1 Tax=Aquimarina agarilytica TaxID=1087449 RepID=UPI000288F82E|nr:choice-of-anchor Q domain-containing protein [Aquimarina agarilytica]